jgi:hypothetical protein
MSNDRNCDKCNLEVPRGTVLTTLCVDGMAHHLVDNISAVQPGNYLHSVNLLSYIHRTFHIFVYYLRLFDELNFMSNFNDVILFQEAYLNCRPEFLKSFIFACMCISGDVSESRKRRWAQLK